MPLSVSFYVRVFLTGKNKGCKGIYLRFCPKKVGFCPLSKPKLDHTLRLTTLIEGR